MTSSAPDLIRRLRAPGYLIMAVTSILPLIDLMMAISPMHPGTVMWRFGAVGLISSAVGAPLLVLVLVYALALLCGDRKVVITVGVIAAVLALLMVVGAGSFTLDALQLKGRVMNPAALDKFKGASALALVKLVVMAISSIVLAVSAFRSAKLSRRETVRATRPGATLIVGQQGTKAAIPERADATT